MRIHACSVAFRHLEVSAADLARYVAREGFDGLEIWAPHARALADEWAALERRPRVPMLAGYLPVGDAGFDVLDARALVALTRDWGADRLRLFAGGTDSALVRPDHRARIIRDLRICADIASDHGIRIALETHPQTLADGLGPVTDLLDALDHPAVGINLDVLHVWESGCDPLVALRALDGHVIHAHLKNVTSARELTVFRPGNIHDANGDRTGICPLHEGAVDYDQVLPHLRGLDASLEWFGPKPAARMAADLRRARQSLTIAA
ncbi:sugar phosphate isomerase/epimerase family protein [Paracoccus sp. 1_MG-2023]|uniref:sugar phosphate isomerase/epimerase family protein n=1 Tax=unclassified Paracoccus (in: a-proteobacteria) TaxID=2688777 RepID=UPI001C0A25A0|nr:MULTISPECIES: sugar phosphate isomerase/epimerase family protein [unclassified Paracoccus (in: a-proteobacteria)]MBU2956097.1 sugar phosphate isomerase/epimerase [Paracoccus sp. C2R09]MDO6669503.1 sugar phosphate isomerase/epimerase family protein [Paracoccus sp. 1_MG-2023]